MSTYDDKLGSLRYKSNLATERQARDISDSEGQPLYPPLAVNSKYAIEGIVPDLSSTRPAPLNVPEAPHPYAWPHSRSLNPTRWDFGYLFKLGKAYLMFYKTGFKNVWDNRKKMKQIQGRLGPHGANTAACNPDSPKLSYNEYELLLRTQRDIRKLLPFGLIFIVCGEFTPLVVLALGSSVVPSTCVIPKQQAKDLQTLLERNNTYRELCQHNKLGARPNFWKLYQLGFTLPRRLYDVPILESFLFAIAERGQARVAAQVLANAVMITREGGWEQRSPADMYEFGIKLMFQPLLNWVQTAQARGQDPVSDEMKSALLPQFEELTNSLVNRDWTKIPEKERYLHAATWWRGQKP